MVGGLIFTLFFFPVTQAFLFPPLCPAQARQKLGRGEGREGCGCERWTLSCGSASWESLVSPLCICQAWGL